ncbi:MAG: rod shape-determining protein MreC [Chitinophagales bacterium]
MRSFFLFIIRYYAIFLFLLLELISLYFVFTYNNFHRTYFINSANTITGNVLNTYGNFQTYFTLREVNDSLLNENALLRQQIVESVKLDTNALTGFKDSSGVQLYNYISAEVIGNSISEPNNYITLDRGSNSGIEVNWGVITSSGIVGKVVKVSPNFCVVMSVLNSQFKSPVAIKKNNAGGRILWEGKSPTHVSIIEVSEPGRLMQGDTIISTSTRYPPGTMIGTLQKYGKEPGSNYYKLDVKLSTNFNSLKYVYVVNELMKLERETLENEVINADN